MNFDFDFDHVGIAVEKIDSALSFYKALGIDDVSFENLNSEGLKVAMMTLGNKSKIELLEPTTSESPVAKYIEKKGVGLHHICLRVKKLEEILLKLKGEGVTLIDEKPRDGAHNCKIAFIHPKSTGGVLIELSESKGGKG